MFTGIIESLAKVKNLERSNSNLILTLQTSVAKKLKVNQSVAHNGVCLTVTNVKPPLYKTIAIAETLSKSNLGSLKIGEYVNIERSLSLSGRLDGHVVQGHVDVTAICFSIYKKNGSWLFWFELEKNNHNKLLVEKGSIAVNGISLTLVNVKKNKFSVAIIPHTYKHSTFSKLCIGSLVNIEFDILGKYVAKMMK